MALPTALAQWLWPGPATERLVAGAPVTGQITASWFTGEVAHWDLECTPESPR
jgi:hypothetical protein